jgi:hypothetical protein
VIRLKATVHHFEGAVCHCLIFRFSRLKKRPKIHLLVLLQVYDCIFEVNRNEIIIDLELYCRRLDFIEDPRCCSHESNVQFHSFNERKIFTVGIALVICHESRYLRIRIFFHLVVCNDTRYGMNLISNVVKVKEYD